MIRTSAPWEELQSLETLQRLFLREAGIRPPWRKEPLGEKSKLCLKTREKREEYREEFIETLGSFDPDAKDMARNDWREQFCLVLLPQPLQMRRQSEVNTESQSRDGAVKSMSENGDSNETMEECWGNGLGNQEDLGAPIQVNETIVA